MLILVALIATSSVRTTVPGPETAREMPHGLQEGKTEMELKILANVSNRVLFGYPVSGWCLRPRTFQFV